MHGYTTSFCVSNHHVTKAQEKPKGNRNDKWQTPDSTNCIILAYSICTLTFLGTADCSTLVNTHNNPLVSHLNCLHSHLLHRISKPMVCRACCYIETHLEGRFGLLNRCKHNKYHKPSCKTFNLLHYLDSNVCVRHDNYSIILNHNKTIIFIIYLPITEDKFCLQQYCMQHPSSEYIPQ